MSLPFKMEQIQVPVQLGHVLLVPDRLLGPEMLDGQDIRDANPLPQILYLHTDIHIIDMETIVCLVVKPNGGEQSLGDKKTDPGDVRGQQLFIHARADTSCFQFFFMGIHHIVRISVQLFVVIAAHAESHTAGHSAEKAGAAAV